MTSQKVMSFKFNGLVNYYWALKGEEKTPEMKGCLTMCMKIMYL
jgi:hypothetical protein